MIVNNSRLAEERQGVVKLSLLRQADTKQIIENGKKQPRIVARLMGANWEEHSRV